MLRLRRLKVHTFRTVAPGTEVWFHDACNLLLGRSGTGKTTLLELVSMALRFDFSDLEDEELDIELDMDGELAARDSDPAPCRIAVRLEAAPRPPMTRIPPPKVTRFPSIPVPDRHNERALREKGTIELGAARVEYTRDGHDLRLTCDGGEPESFVLDKDESEFEDALGIGAAAALVLALDARPPLWWDTGSSPLRFDELCGIFELLTGELTMDVLRFDPSEQDITPPGIVASCQLAPHYLLTAVENRVQENPDGESLTLGHTELPFLRAFIELCGFASATMQLSVLQRFDVQEPENVEQLVFGNIELVLTREGHRGTLDHTCLSHGQTRLLALLYYLDANPHHLIADELLSTLHHAWARRVIREIGERQVFLSSRTTHFLDHLTFDSAENAEKALILCQLDSAGRMIWRNMSRDEAGAFFSAYRADTRHAAELLRANGFC